MILRAFVLAFGLAFASSAFGQDAAALTADWFENADPAPRAEIRERLTALADGGDATARFGLGSTGFFAGLERFAQAMNRHGIAPRNSMFLSGFTRGLPPLPEGAQGTVEPLDYRTFRDHLERLHNDLDVARTHLARVERSAQTRIVIDLGKAVLDLQDGEAGTVSLRGIAERTGFMRPGAAGRATAQPNDLADAVELVFAFDTADAVWLQGYSQVLMAQLDFALAHDFQPLFDATFHIVFPRAGLPLQELLPPPRQSGSLFGDTILDIIAAVHLTSFEVVDAERRTVVRERLLRVVELSRENWRLIRSESDADREWLPGPQQKGAHPIPGVDIEERQVEAWLATLATARAVLDGELLVPHPRFTPSARTRGEDVRPERGIDLKRFFEEPKRFDLVLFLQGANALPYLREGRVVPADDWLRTQNVFGRRGLFGTALWFN